MRYLLIELFYIGLPVVRTDGQAVGRCTVTWLPNFLGWLLYHIFLPMVFRCARAPLKRKSLKSGFGFLNWNLPWGRISRRWNPFSDFAFDSGFPNRTQPYIADLSHVTSYENVPLASRGLLWAWDCVGIAFPDNSFWDLIGDTRLGLCFKTRVQSYWYENDFLYVMRRKLIFQLTNVLHLASLWKWDFFGTRKWPFFSKIPQ